DLERTRFRGIRDRVSEHPGAVRKRRRGPKENSKDRTAIFRRAHLPGKIRSANPHSSTRSNLDGRKGRGETRSPASYRQWREPFGIERSEIGDSGQGARAERGGPSVQGPRITPGLSQSLARIH